MRFRKTVVLLCGMAAVGAAFVLTTSFAQDAETQLGDDESGRLPPGYSAIVKKSQRKEIYAIQDRYAKQIDELRKQISAIEEKRDTEIENVLTDKQKEILAFIRALREEEKEEEAKAEKASAPADAEN